MAPSRGKGKVRSNATPKGHVSQRSHNRPARSSRSAANPVPDVYEEMLAEASAAVPFQPGDDRPLKRRKVLSEHRFDEAASTNNTSLKETLVDHALEANQRQTIQDSSEDEAHQDDDDESDFQFEDVDLEQSKAKPVAAEEGIADLSISIDHATAVRTAANKKRKPVTSVERAHRLVVHKMHILYLIFHCMHVNRWCNDEVVHRTLQVILSKKIKGYLNPSPKDSQFQRNRSFMDGLKQAVNMFKLHFSVTASGFRRPRWLEQGQDIEDLMIDRTEISGRKEFRHAAGEMEGSQDVGNQLFCALLRSVGVKTRMICSLQVLPFTSSGMVKEQTPKRPMKRTVFSLPTGKNALAPEADGNDSALTSSSRLHDIPSARRRLGAPSFTSDAGQSTSKPNKKSSAVRKLAYPVFWAEAFNEAHQSWVTLDPLVTGSLNKSSAIEPPSSYNDNQMVYAIAFESDGVAKDITVRYAKAFNAKTRRQRVEITAGGCDWLKSLFKVFRRRRKLNRDSIEDAELNQRLGREGLPSNVQDFKNHPVYALERHLKRNEVVHPRRDCGKVNAGTAARPKMEVVFRRADVIACKSAEKWYRVGREVKKGEQPLKYVSSRRQITKSRPSESDGDADVEASSQTGLYGLYQTSLYIPPSVIRGRVPRNAFGNLDVYVPSMVPKGGTHIRHPLAKQAAQLLRVDAADAVTGFKFKGRQGTAIIEGVIVPTAFADAIVAVIEGLEYDRELEESKERCFTALRVWKRLLLGLRIAERVAAYGTGDEKDNNDIAEADTASEKHPDKLGISIHTSVEEAEMNDRALITAGQFSLHDAEIETKLAKKQKKKKASAHIQEGSESEATFTARDEVEAEFTHSASPRRMRLRKTRTVQDNSDESDNDVSDFVHGDDEDFGAGGFLPDDIEPSRQEGNVAGSLATDDCMSDSNSAAGGFLVPDDDEIVTTPTLPLDDTQESTKSYNLHSDELEKSSLEDVHASPDLSASLANEVPQSFEVPHQSEANAREPVLDERNSSEDKREPQYNPTSSSNPNETPLSEDVSDDNGRDSYKASDQGSLLSHDPEDEDAEPDWLESE